MSKSYDPNESMNYSSSKTAKLKQKEYNAKNSIKEKSSVFFNNSNFYEDNVDNSQYELDLK